MIASKNTNQKNKPREDSASKYEYRARYLKKKTLEIRQVDRKSLFIYEPAIKIIIF